MKNVTPKWYLIADPSDTGQLEQFLVDNQIAWRPDPKVSFTENLMEFAGRLCYESWASEDGTFANLNISKVREGNETYLGNVLQQKHGSIFEHGGLVYLFNNVSRIFTHEQVRHRLAGFSQTSGRYCRNEDIPFWIPPVIADDPEAKAVFEDIITRIEDAQLWLADHYDIDNKSFSEKKKLTSAFRRIAPNGIANNLLMSTNHRAMRHMITMRASVHAEEEIYKIYSEIAVDLKARYPSIYQDLEFVDGSWSFRNTKV